MASEGLARQVGPVALWGLASVLSLANLYLQSRHLQPWRLERCLFGLRRRR
jgi:hypothetical protein